MHTIQLKTELDDITQAYERHYLLDLEPRSRICKNCGVLFVQFRTDQQSCTHACACRSAVKRHRAAKRQGKPTPKRGRPRKL